MIKQEEIREGMIKILREHYGDIPHLFPWYVVVDELLAYLYSQGVMEHGR